MEMLHVEVENEFPLFGTPAAVTGVVSHGKVDPPYFVLSTLKQHIQQRINILFSRQ